DGARCRHQRAARLARGVRAGCVSRRVRWRHRRRVPRRVSRRRLRSASLCLRGGDRGWSRQPAGRNGRKPARRSPRHVRQGSLPRALVLHALCPDGADPRASADGTLRPALMRRRFLWACLIAGSIAILAAILPAYPLALLTQTLIAAMFAMSLDLL